jgi:hypothetical protein
MTSVGESAADIKSLARVSALLGLFQARACWKNLFPFQKAACIISTDEVLCLLPQVYSKKAAVHTINYSAAMWEALFNAKLFKLHNSAERSRAVVSFAQIFQVHKWMRVFTPETVVLGSSFVSNPRHKSKLKRLPN